MSNSLKYASPDRKPTIEIRFVKSHGYSKLSIQDNGSGMDLTKQEKNLFKPFQRFSSKSGGMGIGLHLVNSMVTRNGGHIIVESKPGEGTKFILNLKEYDT